MDRAEKIDCRANGEVIFQTMIPLHLKTHKNVLTRGSQCRPENKQEPLENFNYIKRY
jgi:hypothetical protein